MSDRVLHCPFLNRTDSRCSNHFSLDRLGHAFQYCFGQYKACPTYLELLVERRVRHASDMILQSANASSSQESPEPRDGNYPYVQLRLPTNAATGRQESDRYQKSVA